MPKCDLCGEKKRKHFQSALVTFIEMYLFLKINFRVDTPEKRVVEGRVLSTT